MIKRNTKKTTELKFGSQNLLFHEKTNGVWFHGTSFSCCESICREGINEDRGKKNQDFSTGTGFYFSQSFKTALEWAAGRDLQQSKQERFGAVLIYNFDYKSMGYEGVDLYEDPTNEKWKMVINYYRNGVKSITTVEEKEFFVKLKKAAFIHGAMSGDGHKKEKLIPRKKKQLCIKGNSTSEKISTCLIGVVYLDRRAK